MTTPEPVVTTTMFTPAERAAWEVAVTRGLPIEAADLRAMLKAAAPHLAGRPSPRRTTMTPDIPRDAITAAGNALRERWLRERPNVVLPSFGLDPMEWAVTALEAAAPHLAHGHGPDVSVNPGCQACKNAADAEREACAQLADQVAAHYGRYVGIEGSHGTVVTSGLRPFGALLRENPR